MVHWRTEWQTTPVILPQEPHEQYQYSSVAQSCPTLRPHESQHARPPCPSPTPGVHPDSHPSSQWCHPAILSSVIPFCLSQDQGFFQWVSSSYQAAKVLELQHQSFQWIFRTSPSWSLGNLHGVFLCKKKKKIPFIYKVWFPGQQWSTISRWFCTLGIRGYLQ